MKPGVLPRTRRSITYFWDPGPWWSESTQPVLPSGSRSARSENGAMKIRELKRRTGNSAFHVWPPVWAWSYGADSRQTGDEGVLTDVHRWDIGLWLAMMYDGR